MKRNFYILKMSFTSWLKEIRRREARLSLFKDKQNLSWQHTETSWRSKCPNVHDSVWRTVRSDPSFYVPTPYTHMHTHIYTHVRARAKYDNTKIPHHNNNVVRIDDDKNNFWDCIIYQLFLQKLKILWQKQKIISHNRK